MAQSVTMVGAHIKLYLNGAIYSNVESISYTIDTADTEIYGVDSLYPLEIVPGRSTVSGSVTGLKFKNAGGLQAKGIRGLAKNILSQPYISVRIQDRSTGEDILLVNQARVTNETFTASAKQTVKLSFNWKGIVPYQPLDRQ